MFAPVIDLLFPNRCLGCGGTGWPFCEACDRSVARLRPPGCLRCGRPLGWEVPACGDCPPAPVSWARAPLLYEGPVRRALFRLKFSGWRSAARALAPLMAESSLGAPGFDAPEVTVTWVPLGRRRKRRRGFDQAEALARCVAGELGWPARRLLARPRETAPQAMRRGPERRLALAGAFRATARPPPAVLLVDDILTSGATAAECARVLLAAGAERVGLLTAARSLGGPIPARCYDTGEPPPGSVVAREELSR